MRIFLDTNVLVSAYAARGICTDLVRHILAEHELVTGEVNLTELRRVLRDRFHAAAERIAAIESELRAETVVPRPSAPSRIRVRDPDDRRVLASALSAEAHKPLPGDQDLLAGASPAPTPLAHPPPEEDAPGAKPPDRHSGHRP